jgi:hypothetical protein
MLTPFSRVYLDDIASSLRVYFGGEEPPAYIRYELDCQNEEARRSIVTLVTDWSDDAYERAKDEGHKVSLHDYPFATWRHEYDENVELRARNPRILAQMLREIGPKIRQIRHDYPPLGNLPRDLVEEPHQQHRRWLINHNLPFIDPPFQSPLGSPLTSSSKTK